MKTLILTILALTAAVSLAFAGPESDRAAGESFGVAAVRPDGNSDPAEITPTRAEGGLIGLLKLLFRGGGDIEIDAPRPPVQGLEGELQDDDQPETYSPGETYEPLGELAEPAPSRTTPSRGATLSLSQVPQDLLRRARQYFNANSGQIANKNYMAIIDFSQHSSQARFYIIDLRSEEVRAIRVAHGQGSDRDHDGYATIFSNTPDSHASSLGFYLTGDTYRGKHGSSMRLQGLSATNSNAMDRAIVIHEATYVQEANVKQGRSYGCPAVAASQIAAVISALRGGALIYAGLANSDI